MRFVLILLTFFTVNLNKAVYSLNKREMLLYMYMYSNLLKSARMYIIINTVVFLILFCFVFLLLLLNELAAMK